MLLIEVLTAVTTNSVFFWDVTPCSRVVHQCVGGPLVGDVGELQDHRASHPRKQ
jgi:hypothetical protein